ncbi:hypothetical protein [Gilvimarinus algae]|uniref:Uncharacterized protein n=1 Tax=Gilvimarinus algae TaxID=3058037 RepID=A0ABT8THG1_9GAMM|nr:hypothetical protein [Gilvimarinus sp. SDUM040014]MDO3383508.1 hypothetical protein [Gilvimarinus sp. SDUM040014]
MDILKRIALVMMFALPLMACENNDGAAEEFGEKVDNAVDNTRDAMDDAADEVSDGVEDACEEVSDENC